MGTFALVQSYNKLEGMKNLCINITQTMGKISIDKHTNILQITTTAAFYPNNQPRILTEIRKPL